LSDNQTDINLRELITRMREYADHIRAENPDIDAPAAYEKAIVQIFMVTAESLDVSPFEARVLDVLDGLSPREHTPPVPTRKVAARLGISDWSTWYHLSRLEKRGLITRPQGGKSGWKVA
jgi:hypothetical protein